MPKASVTQAEMRRAIKAVQECGLAVQECKMENGAFRVITGSQVKHEGQKIPANLKTFDDL